MATETTGSKTTRKAKGSKAARKPASKKGTERKELSANELTLRAWKKTYENRKKFLES